MEEKFFHPMPVHENQDEISRSVTVRDVPPAHFIFKIESFSSLLETKVNKCESRYFNASGHRWRLSLYPNGRKERNGNGHISLYLTIVETENFTSGWRVNVNFKMFVFDQTRNNYLTIQDADAKVRQFHENKKEWGFDKFIPLSTFNDPSNHYLVDDCCVFGVEVFVIERSEGECLKFIKEPAYGKHTWKIENFSTLKENFYYSQVFSSGNSKWKMLIYPKGSVVKTKYLSLFLYLDDWQTLPAGGKLYVDFRLTLKDQLHSKHFVKEACVWLGADTTNWGFPKMILLTDLNDPSKGFLLNNTLIVKARLRFICVTKKLV